MGISMITALEIFSNPKDIEIQVVKDERSGKYAIVFTRGPGHNFKLMLDSPPVFEKLEVAIGAIKETLEFVQEHGNKELSDKNSLFAKISNPEGQEVDQSRVLNSDTIARIIEELKKNMVASTYKMFATTG